jgi:hypothetical protein
MNAYIVVVRAPKKRSGEYVKRGVIMAENIEEGLRLAKEQFRPLSEDTWQIDPMEPNKLVMFR